MLQVFVFSKFERCLQWSLSENVQKAHGCFRKIRGTPKSSNINRVSTIINHPFWGVSPYFWKHPYHRSLLFFCSSAFGVRNLEFWNWITRCPRCFPFRNQDIIKHHFISFYYINHFSVDKCWLLNFETQTICFCS